MSLFPSLPPQKECDLNAGKVLTFFYIFLKDLYFLFKMIAFR